MKLFLRLNCIEGNYLSFFLFLSLILPLSSFPSFFSRSLSTSRFLSSDFSLSRRKFPSREEIYFSLFPSFSLSLSLSLSSPALSPLFLLFFLLLSPSGFRFSSISRTRARFLSRRKLFPSREEFLPFFSPSSYISSLFLPSAFSPPCSPARARA